MPFTLTDQALVELILLVLLLAAALWQLYRRNTQLEAERTWLLTQQATLQADRTKAIDERELMVEALSGWSRIAARPAWRGRHWIAPWRRL